MQSTEGKAETQATEPPPYEVLGPSGAGERCTLCGSGRGVERIRYRGQLRLWHPACADRYVAATEAPPDHGIADAVGVASDPVTNVTAENDGGGSDTAARSADPAAVAARTAELFAAAERNPVIRITDRAKALDYYRGRAAALLAAEVPDTTIHRLRPPSWSDARDEPQPGDRCSTCRGGEWWIEGGLPKRGWRCHRCHPPHSSLGLRRVTT